MLCCVVFCVVLCCVGGKQVQSLPRLKESRIRLQLYRGKGKVPEEHVGWQILLLYLGLGWSFKPAFPTPTRIKLQIMETLWKRERQGAYLCAGPRPTAVSIIPLITNEVTRLRSSSTCYTCA